MQVEKIREEQHPLEPNHEESNRKKHRRGRRGSRRKSSVASNDNLVEPNHSHARRKSSSSARYFTKYHQEDDSNNDEDNDSPALLSLMDIISEMKRLPSISHTPVEDWKRVRRHSEPPNKKQEEAITSNLNPVQEKPIFSNSFLVLEEEEDEEGVGENMVELFVSPLSKIDSTPKRSRSQSVPTAVNPSLLSVSSRKILFPAHINVSEASALIRERILYSGILKVDKQDSSEANVECEELGASIYIFGSRNRNRALDGDEVAVELVDVDTMLNERKTKRQARQTRRLSVISQTLSSIPEDTIESDIEFMKSRPRYCGKVLCIMERPKNMLFSGTLSLNRPHAKLLDNTSRDRKDTSHPKIIWFIPADKRLPLVAVPIKEAPTNFIKYHEEYKNRIFIGNIQRWPASSLHPFGTIEKEIGWMGELGVHSAALMADHHIKDMDFSETVMNAVRALPQDLTPLDRKNRRDLTDDYVFTFHPEHDVDCAFSIQYSDDGVYDVGIHTSDVAHFVRLMTPLDREARQRCCSVDLVDRKIAILPPSFTKGHCSLEVNTDRLAFSVLCRMTDKGVLLHAWVGKTIIRVKENVLDSTHHEAKQLLHLCEKLQTNRIASSRGSSLTQSYVTFDLAESGYPKDIHRVDQTEQDVLIQELLIVANMEVGQKICCRFPDQALLYRQDSPKMAKLTAIQDYFENDPLTDSVQGLFKLVSERGLSDGRQKALTYMIRKVIPSSKYFSAGGLDIAKFSHYGFGSSICSIFTDPLHNYAAIHTQRQLGAALKGEEQESDNFDEIDKIARHSNSSQLSKLAAEQDSKKLYVAAYIYRQCLSTDRKKLRVEAVVIGLDETCLNLYIPDYHLDISVDVNDTSVPRARTDYNASLHQFTISWEKEEEGQTDVIEFMSQVHILIQVDMKVIRPIYHIELLQL